MDNIKNNQRQGLKRYAVTHNRNCSLGVVTFGAPVLKEYDARIVNISATGIGIEAGEGMEPGIIWFKESVYGKKFGILIWCRLMGLLYRAGIQFIYLTPEEEACFQCELDKQPPHVPFDPQGEMAKLVVYLKGKFVRDFNDFDAAEPRERSA